MMTGHVPSIISPNFEKAACRNVDPELFYAEDCVNPDPEKILEARKICQSCIHRLECLAWGKRYEEFGMWGGLTANERHSLERKQYQKLEYLKEFGFILEG